MTYLLEGEGSSQLQALPKIILLKRDALGMQSNALAETGLYTSYNPEAVYLGELGREG